MIWTRYIFCMFSRDPADGTFEITVDYLLLKPIVVSPLAQLVYC